MADTSAAYSSSPDAPVRPYTPSWFDDFTNRVEQLPFPVPAFYLGLALLLVGIQILFQWQGWGGVFFGFPLIYVVSLAYHLAFMHYLDHVAAGALARIRPLLSVSDSEYETMRYCLTTLPPRPALLAGGCGALYGIVILLVIPFSVQINDLHFVDNPPSRLFNFVFTPVLFFVVGVMLYHAVHQLNVVRRIYESGIRIDLFALRPLYAFSRLSALTVVGIGFSTYAWFLVSPVLLGFNLLFFVLFILVALLTFLLPLRGVHRRLDEEKERLLAENGSRHRTLIDELHRQVDSGDLAGVDDINKTLTSLELERTTLERVSTWPWKPETPRALVAALLLPVVVWLLQWLLERVLS